MLEIPDYLPHLVRCTVWVSKNLSLTVNTSSCNDLLYKRCSINDRHFVKINKWRSRSDFATLFPISQSKLQETTFCNYLHKLFHCQRQLKAFANNAYSGERPHNELSPQKTALFATYTFNSTTFHVRRTMEWPNFQHLKVDFKKFGSDSVNGQTGTFYTCVIITPRLTFL